MRRTLPLLVPIRNTSHALLAHQKIHRRAYVRTPSLHLKALRVGRIYTIPWRRGQSFSPENSAGPHTPLRNRNRRSVAASCVSCLGEQCRTPAELESILPELEFSSTLPFYGRLFRFERGVFAKRRRSKRRKRTSPPGSIASFAYSFHLWRFLLEGHDGAGAIHGLLHAPELSL